MNETSNCKSIRRHRFKTNKDEEHENENEENKDSFLFQMQNVSVNISEVINHMEDGLLFIVSQPPYCSADAC